MSLLGLEPTRRARSFEPSAPRPGGPRAPRRAATPFLAALFALLVLPAAASAADGLRLTDADSGREVTVASGAEIVITLDSNASTGYHWIISTEPDPGVLVAGPDNGAYTAPETDLIGAGGVQTFSYTAGEEGSTWLLLHYVAPGTNEVGRTFELYVDVATAGSAGADSGADELPATTMSDVPPAGPFGGAVGLLVAAAVAVIAIRHRRRASA